MFENLSDRLQNAIHKIKGYGKITEDNISEVMREVRLALLEADVNYKVVKEFTNNVKEKALGEEVQRSINPGDLLFDNALGHVAMYIGNGQWVESPNSGKTVRITNVRWESVQRARRVL